MSAEYPRDLAEAKLVVTALRGSLERVTSQRDHAEREWGKAIAARPPCDCVHVLRGNLLAGHGADALAQRDADIAILS